MIRKTLNIENDKKQARKVKNAETLMNKEGTKIIKNFRFYEIDIQRLKKIASIKKTTETKVITELIRLAYAGLTLPGMQELNKFYHKILEMDKPKTTNRIKKRVSK